MQLMEFRRDISRVQQRHRPYNDSDNFMNRVVVPEEWRANFHISVLIDLNENMRPHVEGTTTMQAVVDVSTKVTCTQ